MNGNHGFLYRKFAAVDVNDFGNRIRAARIPRSSQGKLKEAAAAWSIGADITAANATARTGGAQSSAINLRAPRQGEIMKVSIAALKPLNASPTLLRSLCAIVIIMTFGTPFAEADFSCQGTLRQGQRIGFEHMFSPPYSMSLVNTGVGSINMSKRLTVAQLQTMRAAANSRVVAIQILTDTHAKLLRDWLNENATDSVPGWVSTGISIAPVVGWVGLSAEALSQLVNASGDAGRLRVANLAGTVTQGGQVGVLEHVAKDQSGRSKFIVSYIYRAQLNNRQVDTLLASCSADVVEEAPVAQSGCPTGPVEYCYCVYEKSLNDQLQTRGIDQATMKQRISTVHKALDQCLSKQ